MNLPELNLELTLEQQFKFQLMAACLKDLPREEIEVMLLQASMQLMVKDNVIRDLIKKNIGGG